MAISNPAAAPLLRRPTWTRGIGSWITTVDHKRLGILYLVTSFIFLALGSIEAGLIRIQLFRPEQQIVNPDFFNQLFTMHGLTMVFLAIMPMGIGLANYFVPLLIGARDLAFPRMNSFGYWIYALSGLFIYSSFFLGGAPDMGWTGYAPLTSLENNPGHGVDFYMIGLIINGVGTLITAMNLIVTMINLRAPGMTYMRMPLFAWMIFIMSFLIIFAFPPLTIALFQVVMDRIFDGLFYVPQAGGMSILWQHLFWIFGHPEVYIIIMPAFGVISEIIPTFSRKPLFGYPVMVLSGVFIGFMGFAVWSHHMFTTGLGPVANTVFALTSFVIGVPTGIKIFNWVATIWGGQVRFTVSMLYAIAFLITFTLGGITGIMVAIAPFDQQVHDTYFVVAHFHYVMGGGALLAFLGALYYWMPKMSGRLLSESIGKWSWAFIVLGFHLIFFPQHLLGLLGMPRRIQTYEANIGLDFYNMLSSVGAGIMLVGLLLLVFDFFRTLRSGKIAGNDPWDGRTLEWATTSPPPAYNFPLFPVIRDRDPFWVEKHPELLEQGLHSGLDDELDEEARLAEEFPTETFHMPGQSWYPFILAAVIVIGSYGVLYKNWFVALFSLGLMILSIFAWAFEGVGGEYYTVRRSDGKLIEKGQS
jgi:cytochrome c oxidase subunit 1